MTGVGIGVSGVGVIQSQFMDPLSALDSSAEFGFVRLTYFLFGSLASVVVGTIADVADWFPAARLLVGLLAVSVVALMTNRIVGGWL